MTTKLGTSASPDSPGASAAPSLTVYTAATMNGWKPLIALEELGVAYRLQELDFSSGEQKSADFLRLNPNGRIPVIVDHGRGDFALAESGAILGYLAREMGGGRLWPREPLRQYEAEQWLYWCASALGPALGNAMFFQRIAAPQGIVDEYAIDRYVSESKRCLQILEERFADGRQWLMGDAVGFTVVDIMAWTYPATAPWANIAIDPDSYPALHDWIRRMHERTAVARAITLPRPQWHFFGEGDVEAAARANAAQFGPMG